MSRAVVGARGRGGRAGVQTVSIGELYDGGTVNLVRRHARGPSRPAPTGCAWARPSAMPPSSSRAAARRGRRLSLPRGDDGRREPRPRLPQGIGSEGASGRALSRPRRGEGDVRPAASFSRSPTTAPTSSSCRARSCRCGCPRTRPPAMPGPSRGTRRRCCSRRASRSSSRPQARARRGRDADVRVPGRGRRRRLPRARLSPAVRQGHAAGAAVGGLRGGRGHRP